MKLCSFFFASYLIIICLIACQKRSPVITPNLPVYIEINLELNAYKALRIPGGILIIDQQTTTGETLGYGGLVVVRSLMEDKFYAFDASCPYENSSAVSLQIQDLQLKCPDCLSTFEVLYGNGNPIKGEARNPLRRYTCIYEPENHKLLVMN